MTRSILVTGGTGTIGRRVVPQLVHAGLEDIRILSRHGGVDSHRVHHLTGDVVKDRGVREAVRDREVVLHLAGGAKGDDIAARNLARAASAAGVRHLILISVVGAGRMPIGYFRAKDAAERAVRESGIGWSILRAAQLHDFVLPIVRTIGRMPLSPVPGGLRFEPVAADEVASYLAELALGAPTGTVADLAGPEVLDVRSLVTQYARARGRRLHPFVPVRLPGAVGRAYRSGENLAASSARRGAQTWRSFLEEPVAAIV